MLVKQIIAAGEEPMRKTIEKMKADFATIRTGRASTSLVDGIKAESYGTLMPLKQLANINVPDSRTIEIRPWDLSVVQNIQKAIMKSEIGITPQSDGKVIRLSMPKLTEDRRKELIKVVHKMSEEFKVSIRNERRQIVDNLKKSEKDKKITEDDRKKGEHDIQKVTDTYIKKIDEVVKIKEAEIMEV